VNQPNKGGQPFGGGWGREGHRRGRTSLNRKCTRHRAGIKAHVPGVWTVWRKAAKERKAGTVSALLLHHLSVELLRDSFFALQRKASPGIDGVTWAEYENRTGGSTCRSAQPAAPWSVPGQNLQDESLFRRADGPATSVGASAALEGQNCSAGRGDDPQPDIRGRLQRLFLTGFRPGRRPRIRALDALTVGKPATVGLPLGKLDHFTAPGRELPTAPFFGKRSRT